MRSGILAAAAATLFLTLPSLAKPAELNAPLHGTMTTKAWGHAKVVTRTDGRQFVEFDNIFHVSREPGAEVRVVDSSGRVTTLGMLRSEDGAQRYAIPENVKVDENDDIVIYSPAYDENLATVNFLDD